MIILEKLDFLQIWIEQHLQGVSILLIYFILIVKNLFIYWLNIQ